MRYPFLFGFALIAIVGLASAHAAETPEEQNACFQDAQRICPDAIPIREMVFNCLVRNRAHLSRLCRTAIEREVKPGTRNPG